MFAGKGKNVIWSGEGKTSRAWLSSSTLEFL
jgi:hypothetical protein